MYVERGRIAQSNCGPVVGALTRLGFAAAGRGTQRLGRNSRYQIVDRRVSRQAAEVVQRGDSLHVQRVRACARVAAENSLHARAHTLPRTHSRASACIDGTPVL